MTNKFNERLAAGKAIASPLRALESDLDNALARAGQLMMAMATGRQRAKLSAIVGADAFDHLSKTVAALFESRGSIVALHVSLDETRAHLRLPEQAFGDESEKVSPPSGQTLEPLRIVA